MSVWNLGNLARIRWFSAGLTARRCSGLGEEGRNSCWFLDTILSATPFQSKLAICASAIPAAAPTADQLTTLSSARALHALTLSTPYLQTHTSIPQHQSSRTSSRLGIRPSGNATSASIRWYVFNASIQKSPEALNRCAGTGN